MAADRFPFFPDFHSNFKFDGTTDGFVVSYLLKLRINASGFPFNMLGTSKYHSSAIRAGYISALMSCILLLPLDPGRYVNPEDATVEELWGRLAELDLGCELLLDRKQSGTLHKAQAIAEKAIIEAELTVRAHGSQRYHFDPSAPFTEALKNFPRPKSSQYDSKYQIPNAYPHPLTLNELDQCMQWATTQFGDLVPVLQDRQPLDTDYYKNGLTQEFVLTLNPQTDDWRRINKGTLIAAKMVWPWPVAVQKERSPAAVFHLDQSFFRTWWIGKIEKYETITPGKHPVYGYYVRWMVDKLDQTQPLVEMAARGMVPAGELHPMAFDHREWNAPSERPIWSIRKFTGAQKAAREAAGDPRPLPPLPSGELDIAEDDPEFDYLPTGPPEPDFPEDVDPIDFSEHFDYSQLPQHPDVGFEEVPAEPEFGPVGEMFEMTAQEHQERYVDWPKEVPLPESSDSEAAEEEEKADEPAQTQAALDLEADFYAEYGYDPELDSGVESGYDSAASSVARRVKRRHDAIPVGNRAVYAYTPYVSPAPSDSEEEDAIAQQFNTTAPPLKMIEPDPEGEYDELILPARDYSLSPSPSPSLSPSPEPIRLPYPDRPPDSTDSEPDETCDYHPRGRRRFMPPQPVPAPRPPGNNIAGALFLVVFLITGPRSIRRGTSWRRSPLRIKIR